MVVGRRLRLRAFLEGIEVPCVSAFLQVSPNAPAACAVQIIPTEQISKLKPRTLVHVFYLDPKVDPDSPPPVDGSLADYKLFFGGDLAGTHYSKTPTSRQCVLQCVDHSSYWDTTYQFFISYGPNGNMFDGRAAVWGGGSIFNNITSGHMQVLNQYLRSKPMTPGLEHIQGLLGGILSLLEAMGGIRNRRRGINDFFTIAELRVGLMQQLAATQNDTTEKKLFDGKAFWQWLTRGMTSMGQISTFRDMLKLLFKHIYYDVVPNPIAQFIPGEAQKAETREVAVTTAHWPTAADLATLGLLSEQGASLSKRFSAAQTYSPTAAAEHISRSSSGAARQERQLAAMLTRPSSMPRTARSYLIQAQSFLAQIAIVREPPPSGRVAGLWASVKRVVDLAAGLRVASKKEIEVEDVIKRARLPRLPTQIFRPECFFVAPPRCNVIFPEQYSQLSYGRNFLMEPTRLWMSRGTLFVGHSIGGYFPKVTYAPSLADIRRVAKEQGNRGLRSLMPWEKFTGILPKFEMIPDLTFVAARSEVKRRIRTRGMKGAAASYAQRVANFNFLRHRLAGRTANLTAIFTPEIVCGFPGVVIDRPFIPTAEELRKAVADSRLSRDPRQVRFDEPLRSIREIADSCGAPMHALGVVATFSHSVGQDGGVTNVTMTHVRGHKLTNDDFLIQKSYEATEALRKRVVETTYDTATLIRNQDTKKLLELALATPQDFTLADLEAPPAQPAARNVTLSTRTSPSRQATGSGQVSAPDPVRSDPLKSLELNDSTVTVPPANAGSGAEGRVLPLQVRASEGVLEHTGTTILEPPRYAKRYAPGTNGPRGGVILQMALGDPGLVAVSPTLLGWDLGLNLSKVLLWRSLTIYEEVSEPAGMAEVPLEEAMRPAWFSPLYSNWLIGRDVYQPFFGCDSIVDRTVYQFADEDETNVFGVSAEEEKQIREEIEDSDADPSTINQVIASHFPKRLSEVPSVETAVNALAFLYGKVRQNDLDVHQFIADYTRRPIATLEEILGSADLRYDFEGPGGGANADDAEMAVTQGKAFVVQGTPGFHSRAILPYDNLIGLLDNPDQELPSRLGKGKNARISRDLDPRPERRKAVEDYLESLNISSQGLAIGLKG